ncbi:MAG: nucleotidyltransferase family protein [Clostridia bacterium]|nr:nucleotidyltransferase family protein [Clostridia bacterium]
MGCVDAIAFGSESGDARIIEKAAKIISGDLSEAIKPYLSEGMTFAAARQKAVESIEKEAAELLQNPNDTLAVEYVSHLLDSGIKPIAIKRIGAAHDGEVKNGFASASEIRKMIISGDRNEFKKYMPESAAEIIDEQIEKGLAPACKSLIAPIELASGKNAYFVGKPNPLMMRTGLKLLGVHSEEAVMIGDRMDTDIIAGIETGLDTALVLTGCSTRDTVNEFPYTPTYILEGVKDIPTK